jgi:hypothetical protein
MHQFMKVVEHHVMHKAQEGVKEGPITTGVGIAVGTVGMVTLTVATGGLALAPIGISAFSGAFLGLVGGGLMGSLTKK